MAINIVENFRNGGIRRGKVFLLDNATPRQVYSPLGRIKNVTLTAEPNESDPDSTGRTSVISYNLTGSVTMMQHTAAEVQAAGELAYPPDASEYLAGYNVLFTDKPLTTAEVNTALTGGTIPGILVTKALPKPSINLNFAAEDSEITITLNGLLPPDVFNNFAASPILPLG